MPATYGLVYMWFLDTMNVIISIGWAYESVCLPFRQKAYGSNTDTVQDQLLRNLAYHTMYLSSRRSRPFRHGPYTPLLFLDPLIV